MLYGDKSIKIDYHIILREAPLRRWSGASHIFQKLTSKMVKLNIFSRREESEEMRKGDFWKEEGKGEISIMLRRTENSVEVGE